MSAAMFSTMFHRLTWTNIFYYIRAIRLYLGFCLSLSVILTPHFSNFAEFRQLLLPNVQTKYYEILSAHIKTHHNTTDKIANRISISDIAKQSDYFWAMV